MFLIPTGFPKVSQHRKVFLILEPHAIERIVGDGTLADVLRIEFSDIPYGIQKVVERMAAKSRLAMLDRLGEGPEIGGGHRRAAFSAFLIAREITMRMIFSVPHILDRVG
jgi:hypothetical protein